MKFLRMLNWKLTLIFVKRKELIFLLIVWADRFDTFQYRFEYLIVGKFVNVGEYVSFSQKMIPKWLAKQINIDPFSFKKI